MRGARKRHRAGMVSPGGGELAWNDNDEAPVHASRGIHRVRGEHTDLELHVGNGPGWIDTYPDTRDRYAKQAEPTLQIHFIQNSETVPSIMTVLPGVQKVEHISGLARLSDIKSVINLYKQCFNTTGANSNSTAPSMQGGDADIHPGTTNSTKAAIFPVIQQRVTFFNPSNADVYLELFELTCIENTDIAPDDMWDKVYDAAAENVGTAQLTSMSLAGGLIGTQSANLTTKERIGERPKGALLWKHWKQTGYLKTRLQTARSLSYVHGLYDVKLLQTYITNHETTYIEGVSKVILFVLRGETIQNNDVGPPDTSAMITTSSGQLYYKLEENYTCRHWSAYDTTKRVIMHKSGTGANVFGYATPAGANQVFENTETDGAVTGYDATDIS